MFFLLLAAAGCAIAVITLHALYRYVVRATSLNHLPGPPVPSYVWGSAVDMRAAPVGKRYNVWKRQYGPTYRQRRNLLEPVLIMGDPKGASHVLNSKVSNYDRPEFVLTYLEIWFGRSMFCTSGEEHKRMRKQLNPAFSNQSIQEVSHVFFDLAHRLHAEWEQKLDNNGSAIFDISERLHILTLDAISMTMFAHNMSSSEGSIPDLLQRLTNGPSVDSVATRLMGILITFFPQALRYLPNPMLVFGDRLRNELGKIAEEVWGGVKKDAGLDAKILQYLSKDLGDGQSVSKNEAVAQIIAVLFAGSESTANVMGEFFLEMAMRPSIQQKVREELIAFEVTHGCAPGYDDLMNGTALPYFEAVSRETMRLKPVLMEIMRCAAEDDIIPLQHPLPGSGDNYVAVKKGTKVSVPVRNGINIDQELWGADAEEFKPERWLNVGGLPDGVKSIRAQGNIMTFGDGPKVCIGRTFALAEFKIIASSMLRQFSFESEGSIIDFYHLGADTVKPKIRGREAEGVQLPLRVTKL